MANLNHPLLKMGIEYLNKGNLKEAQKNFLEILGSEPHNFDALLNLGLTFAHAGKLQDAKQQFLKASSTNPDAAEPHYNLGIICSLEKNLVGAIHQYQQATKLNPKHIEAYTNLSDLLNQLGRHEEALDAANKAIALDSPYPETWLNQGKAFDGTHQLFNAIESYRKVLNIQPLHAEGLFCLAYSLDEAQDYQQALKIYALYLNHYPKNPSVLTNKGSTLNKVLRYQEALEALEESIRLNPLIFMTWLNAGTALHNLRQFEKALTYYDQALSIQTDNAQAWSNKGNTLTEMQRYKEALNAYDKALSIEPKHADALKNKGNTLIEMKRYEEALLVYEDLIATHPHTRDIQAQITHLKMRLCDWANYEAQKNRLYQACVPGSDTCAPFISLGVFNDEEAQKIIAQKWSEKRIPPNTLKIDPPKAQKKQKIRIGYFSPDFKNHPVSFLIAELIELHDRERFEIIAFSFGVDNVNPMQERLSGAFDQFINVQNKSESEIALLSREMGIDIAIDLCGHTHENRFGIFANRAAPIQVSYLGHPGTMGASCIDYIFADHILIPTEKSCHYTEKLVHLPYCFQINDRKRVIANQKLNKADFGLPENKLIYCCFNNNFKITPDVFQVWMKILQEVENSVLWLLEDTPAVSANLKNEASKAGVDPERIIFAGRVAPELYLARYQLADIFLDTCPFNGGATASDALWAGLPIITKLGDAYAGRMAGSLLHAIGLPELVTNTTEEYIKLAKTLGQNKSQLELIKNRLAANRLNSPLFNTPLNVQYIEKAYEEMMKRHTNKQAPDHIQIPP